MFGDQCMHMDGDVSLCVNICGTEHKQGFECGL